MTKCIRMRARMMSQLQEEIQLTIWRLKPLCNSFLIFSRGMEEMNSECMSGTATLQYNGTVHFYSVSGTQNYKSMCPLTSSNSQLNYYKHQMAFTGLIFKYGCLKISHFIPSSLKNPDFYTIMVHFF